MQKQFFYLQKNISYKIYGNGDAVVLIHGFGEDSQIFNQQIHFLQNYCKLIVPDLPGSGYSEYNDDFTGINHFALCINAILENENINQCTMLGHSMGGYITLAFVEMFAHKINAFGLLHSTAFADSPEKKVSRTKGIELMQNYGSYAFLKNTIPNLFAQNFKTTQLNKVEQLINNGNKFTTLALQQYYTIMKNREDKTNVLISSKCPVLFIIGKEDVAVPINDVLPQTILAETSYIHVLNNVGHMGMWEATEAFNNYLLQFIKR